MRLGYYFIIGLSETEAINVMLMVLFIFHALYFYHHYFNNKTRYNYNITQNECNLSKTNDELHFLLIGNQKINSTNFLIIKFLTIKQRFL